MRAYRGHTEGKNFVWKIYWNFPLNLRVLPADSDGSICKKWMQNALRFVMKNRSFFSLINKFKIRIKSYSSKRKKPSIFHQKSGGVLHPLFAGTSIRICRYYHQNLLQVIPSDLEGNFRAEISVYFSDEVFSLGMPSVCPHLTTVWFERCVWP